MRDIVDCAVVGAPGTEAWVAGLMGRRAGGHLRLQALMPAGLAPDEPESVRAALLAREGRYDACLVAVSPEQLVWTRVLLSALQGVPHAPVLALTRGLQAVALDDLCRLGLADFLRHPCCEHELRVRIERVAPARLGGLNILTSAALIADEAAQHPPSLLREPPLAGDAAGWSELACPPDGVIMEACAAAMASSQATDRDSFRAAKGRVVARFERAYISSALQQHGGNISQAARAVHKHRRAFWALMRKHQIDPSPYREG